MTDKLVLLGEIAERSYSLQRLTEANEQHAKPRNPIGCRTLHDYAGDCILRKGDADV